METETLIYDLKSPTSIIQHPKKRDMFVTDQRGQIYSIAPRGEATLWLDIQPLLVEGQESGLLSLAFSPNGRYAYIFSSRPLKSISPSKGFPLFLTRPEEITEKTFVDTVSVLPLSPSGKPILEEEKTLLAILRQETVHHGGRLLVTPEGDLFITTGDGGPQMDPYNHAQDLSSILGKILRITPHPEEGTYTIPSDNPFIYVEGALPEIYAYGLRNPWALTEYRGEYFIADVGYETHEMIYLLERGANYGWNIKEGSTHTLWPKSRIPILTEEEAIFTPPIFEYQHRRDTPTAIIGGYYIGEENNYYSSGYYFSDFIGPVLRITNSPLGWDLDGEWSIPQGESIYTWGKDRNGSLYIGGIDKDGIGYLKIIVEFS